ncbi:hypothetical protein BKA70DRAFT_1214243 [Coprinopsis sp. MPI-PUGE-AT-0042]|nr:hypothetical protein BKA70DRAFT_1214243 [Coprinopsis sp. MPI-PUGE-AT-0042]
MSSQTSTPSSSMVFPIRLLQEIVAYTSDRNTLLQLLVCNRTLNRESERILYSAFDSYRRDEAGQWVPVPVSKLLNFLERTMSSKHLASYVRRIALEETNPDDPLLPEFWRLFGQALGAMCNVKVLGLISTPPFAAKCSEILANCKSAFQLKVFDWNCRELGKESSKKLKAFLMGQTRLQHIILYDWADQAVVRMAGLVTLRAYSPNAVKAFTSGNMLRALRWNLARYVAEEEPVLTSDFIRGLGSLRHLEIAAAEESLISHVAVHLRHLRTLELQQCREMPKLASLLSYIPHLKNVLLDRGDVRITREYVREIFERNVSIEIIDVRNDFGGAPYRRWLRGAREPIPGPDRHRNRNITYLPWGQLDGKIDEWLAFA